MKIADELPLMVGWKVSSLSPNIASIRYRVLLPVRALEKLGVQCRLFSDADLKNLHGLDILVVVKSFTANDICLIQEARARGIPVVFDLCDNVFVDGYRKVEGYSASEMFLAIANNVSRIVVPTEPLADEIRRQVGLHIPVNIVPDGIDSNSLPKGNIWQFITAKSVVLRKQARKLLGQVAKLTKRLEFIRNASFLGILHRLGRYFRKYLQWQLLARKIHSLCNSIRRFLNHRKCESQINIKGQLAQSIKYSIPFDPSFQSGGSDSATQKVHRILWFGNHGGPHGRFGILDLLEIREDLEQIAREFSVELVVLSNNMEKYRNYILPFAIPSCYVKWSMEAMEQQLRRADVVVVPNTLDRFSVCKSSNRVVTALSHGIPVVANSTPALMPLSDCIELDDFRSGLYRYLTDREYARCHVERGQKRIVELYGESVIGEKWLEIFRIPPNSLKQKNDGSGEFIVVLNLIQDLDLAVPVLLAAQKRKFSVEAWCSTALFRKSPRVKTTLDSLGINWRILPDQLVDLEISNIFRRTKAMLAVSETNLGPHRFSHCLTKVAKDKGVVTGTMQHGFENVGLNYTDEFQAIEKIKFASERIYIWGPLEMLHPDIPFRTRAKCIPVGCPKSAYSKSVNLSKLLPINEKVVGIFENLHWIRYSEAYRKFFLNGVQSLAMAFPDIAFLVKPHHAGLWLTSRHKGNKPNAPNLIIADPQNPIWEPFTAAQLFNHLHAVISSPSTVALDAARIGLPVAVVTYNLNCDMYDPLFRIKAEGEWQRYIRDTCDISMRNDLIASSGKFVNKVLIEGKAAETIIIDDMVERIHRTAHVA